MSIVIDCHQVRVQRYRIASNVADVHCDHECTPVTSSNTRYVAAVVAVSRVRSRARVPLTYLVAGDRGALVSVSVSIMFHL